MARRGGLARWYFDADSIGLGKLLAHARDDVTWPGDDGTRAKSRRSLAPCPIASPATPDIDWIPKVALLGMSIVTRDKMIQSRLSELTAVRESRAKMFAITSDGSLDRWGLLEIVVTQWRAMELQAEEPGPFICSVTRTRLRRLPL